MGPSASQSSDTPTSHSFKKHQKLIDEQALADAEGRVAQAEAIAATLPPPATAASDSIISPSRTTAWRFAQASGRLHRNFQGYTTDACETLIGLGASAIGRMYDGYVQNEVPPGLYAQRIASGRLAT